MDQFLNSIWSENNYSAKVKLLKLAREQRPETQPKDVETFLEAQLSYQLLKETKNTIAIRNSTLEACNLKLRITKNT